MKEGDKNDFTYRPYINRSERLIKAEIKKFIRDLENLDGC